MHWMCGVREREVNNDSHNWPGGREGQSCYSLRLVGTGWEFCFGHSMFGMPIRQMQGCAELAARNMQVEFRRCECGCYHHMDGT